MIRKQERIGNYLTVMQEVATDQPLLNLMTKALAILQRHADQVVRTLDVNALSGHKQSVSGGHITITCTQVL
jgi:hypothetical protein